MNISVESDSKQEDLDRIHQGLNDHNLRNTVPHGYQVLNVFVRNEDGEIKGGLLGATFWSWCHIEIFWLDESLRGQGIGSEILRQAEEEARKRNCIAIFVDTLSFQAPKFYEKHGYMQWGILEDFPPGHQRIFYKKSLL